MCIVWLSVIYEHGNWMLISFVFFGYIHHLCFIDRNQYDVFLDDCMDVSQEFGCAGGNPCVNGGICVPIMKEEFDDNRVPVERPSFNCTCPPAFHGELCELETDRCAEENVCGEFQCLRDPSDLDNGYRLVHFATIIWTDSLNHWRRKRSIS